MRLVQRRNYVHLQLFFILPKTATQLNLDRIDLLIFHGKKSMSSAGFPNISLGAGKTFVIVYYYYYLLQIYNQVSNI